MLISTVLGFLLLTAAGSPPQVTVDCDAGGSWVFTIDDPDPPALGYQVAPFAGPAAPGSFAVPAFDHGGALEVWVSEVVGNDAGVLSYGAESNRVTPPWPCDTGEGQAFNLTPPRQTLPRTGPTTAFALAGLVLVTAGMFALAFLQWWGDPELIETRRPGGWERHW